MKNRVNLCLFGVCALLCGLLLRPWLAPAAAQTPAASQAGRYRLDFNAGAEYFTDTGTGRVWVHAPVLRDTKDDPGSVVGMRWVETGSPVSPPGPDRP